MQSRSYYGMQLAHLGVAVFIVGVTIVTGYQSEQDVRMDVGDTVSAGGYDFPFQWRNQDVPDQTTRLRARRLTSAKTVKSSNTCIRRNATIRPREM